MAPRDFAVFYRTNAQSRVLEEALRARDIPYAIIGGMRFFDRAEIKDLLAYLRASPTPPTRWRWSGSSTCRARHRRRPRSIASSDARDERKISAWRGAASWSPHPEELLATGPAQEAGGLRRADGASCAPREPASARRRWPRRSSRARGYRERWRPTPRIEAEERIENLLELVAQMRDYEREAEEPTLHGFLERVALASDVDGYDPEKGVIR